MAIMQTVLRSAHFSVNNHVCHPPRFECGHVQGGEPARLIFTRRGSFVVHVGDVTCLARPGQAVLVRRDVEYRITHPDPEGWDSCTDLWIDEDTLQVLGLPDLAARPCQALVHDLQCQRAHVEMLIGVERCRDDPQQADEVLFETLDYVLDTHVRARPHARSAAIGRQVARVEEVIVGRSGENLGIEALARVAGCSPFHLCRIFRASTGQSLRQFRMQHRLGTALARLGEGEDDLAALACDTGFSSHSHMTDAFRETLGTTPRALREQLRRSDLRLLQARVQGMRKNARG